MGKMKLYDLAKELNLTSKELLKIAGEMGIDAKSHLSSIDDEDVVKIRNKYRNNSSEEKKEKKQNPNKVQKEPKTTPVIIRREVIIE